MPDTALQQKNLAFSKKMCLDNYRVRSNVKQYGIDLSREGS